MSFVSVFLKKAFRLPEIDLGKTLAVQLAELSAAQKLVNTLDDASFQTLKKAVDSRYLRENAMGGTWSA